jgi:phi13 family phage major tail protein
MAKIGLDNFRYGILNEADDGTYSYGIAKKPGKAIDAEVSIQTNDANLFADDGLAENDSSFQSGTIKLGIDDLDLQTEADLLGHTFVDGEIIKNKNDIAPYVGVGRIITKLINGAYHYKVEFFHKVKFSEPNQNDKTKGENVEFGTAEIEGKIATLANGDWNKAETFDDKADAVAYLEGLFTVSA